MVEIRIPFSIPDIISKTENDTEEFQARNFREDEIFVKDETQWEIATEVYSTEFIFPNFEKPKREIPKDRDILKLINEIKESAKMFLIKAAQNLLPNEQDAGNGIIRNELVWDINGYLDGLVEKGYVQDYQVVCDNRNNPREVFEKGELDAEILIVWDEEHRNTFYKIRVNKKGQVTNVGE